MSRPFSPKNILRAVPRALLRALCDAHKLPLDARADADDLPESEVLALARSLPHGLDARFQTALRDVHDMATEGGTLALIAEARFQQLHLPPAFDALDGPAARAMWFLAHHRDLFHAARLIHAADHLRARSSTTIAGLPNVAPPHATTDLGPLRRALCEYYTTEQGRGRHCHIDAMARGDRLLLFVYLSDYTVAPAAFGDGDRLERRPHRPAFEVVYQFAAAAGILSVFARGRQSVRLDLLDLFCQHLLGVERPSGVVLRPRFRLDHLLRRDAVLPLDPAGGAIGARVRRLKVSVCRTRESVTLDAAPEGGRDDIHRMLDRHFPLAEFPRDDLTVTLATITVGYTTGGRNRTLTFDVTSDGGTNLTSRADDQQDLGERLLRAWGVLDA